MQKPARAFYKPLAIGAPQPLKNQIHLKDDNLKWRKKLNN